MSETPSKASQALAAPKPTPEPRNWVFALLGTGIVAFVFLAAQLIAAFVVSIYPALKHWSSTEANNWVNNAVVGQFFYVLFAEAITIASILAFLVYVFKEKLASIGLRWPRWSDLVFGLAGILPYFILYLLTVGVISWLVPSLNVNEKQQLGFNSVHGGGELLLTFIALVILPPIAEEITFRGFLYKYLKAGLPVFWAVIATCLLFASPHLLEGGNAGPLYIAGIDTFVLSLVLIFLREKTGGLWSSMILHASKNAVAFAALFVLNVH